MNLDWYSLSWRGTRSRSDHIMRKKNLYEQVDKIASHKAEITSTENGK